MHTTSHIAVNDSSIIKIMKLHRFCAAISLSIALVGCSSNNFSKFYTDSTKGSPQAKFGTYSGVTKIYNSKNVQEDAEELFRNGYNLIGQSAFEGASKVTMGQLKEQAREVGADVVLYHNQYLGASQSEMPFLEYQPAQTSTSRVSGTVDATAYGRNGYSHGTANFNGYATTTTPASFNSIVIPVTVHRYAHEALFLRKGLPPILGALVHNLTNEMRQAFETNSGVFVNIVQYDSPAFQNNVIVGDVILSINGARIQTVDSFGPILDSHANQECDFQILRRGKEIHIKIKLNPRYPQSSNVELASENTTPSSSSRREGPTDSIIADIKYSPANLSDIVAECLKEREWTVVSKAESKVVGYIKHHGRECEVVFNIDVNKINIEATGYELSWLGERKQPEIPVRWLNNLRQDIRNRLYPD